MFYVYIIKKNGNTLYIGYTADLVQRMKEHKAIKNDLVYYEAYKAQEDATKREKQLKKYKSSWGQLKLRINKSRI